MVSVKLLEKSTRSVHAIQGSLARFHFSVMLLTCFKRSGLYGYETQRLTFFFTFFFFLSIPTSLILYIFFLCFLPFVLFLFILSYFLSWVSLYAHVYVYFFFWPDSPQWARTSSFTRFLDHTQRHITVGRTPLDE